MSGFNETQIRNWIDECLVGVEEIAKTDAKLSLTSYPNPFTKSTTIDIRLGTKDLWLKAASSVSLTIYDLSGSLIRGWEIKDAELEIVWDSKDMFGKSVVSGIYFCVLEAGNSRMITKLILAR
ncbi:MAG: T9SS type A sorting domain-containing protein [Candidatus Stahlbacteria bacterium]|nr:T9SS type A sorting domain-containing protein [Candidatus Stahlbacteria bacterium]